MADPTLAKVKQQLGNGWDWSQFNPTDWTTANPIGAIGSAAKNFGENIANFYTGKDSSITAPPYQTVPLPKDKEGMTPEEYVRNPNDKEPVEGPISSGPISDQEFQTLQKESANGNSLAMQLLDAYKPKYGETPTQYTQGFAKPLVNDIKGDESLYNDLQTQQSSLDNQLPSALSQAASVAQQYSGISPQAPNAQTAALMSQYGSIANNAIASTTPVMDSALKDMGDAASISLKTFPYETLVSDLLNRYAYQIESPSYPPPPLNIPGIPEAIKNLFAASTGTQYQNSGTKTSVGIPDSSGVTPGSGVTIPTGTQQTTPTGLY